MEPICIGSSPYFVAVVDQPVRVAVRRAILSSISCGGNSLLRSMIVERYTMAPLSVDDQDTRLTLAIIRQFHDAFNHHAVAQIMNLMTDDCVFENTNPPPDGVRLEGHAAVRAYWEDFFRQSPRAHFEIEEVFAHADRGILRWRYTWVDVQGRAGHVRGVDIFAVQNGKVAEKLSYVKG
jgi:ketosteroid isomerase-like protein